MSAALGNHRRSAASSAQCTPIAEQLIDQVAFVPLLPGGLLPVGHTQFGSYHLSYLLEPVVVTKLFMGQQRHIDTHDLQAEQPVRIRSGHRPWAVHGSSLALQPEIPVVPIRLEKKNQRTRGSRL